MGCGRSKMGREPRDHRAMAALNHEIDQFGLPVNPVEQPSRDVAALAAIQAALMNPKERSRTLGRLRGRRKSWQAEEDRTSAEQGSRVPKADPGGDLARDLGLRPAREPTAALRVERMAPEERAHAAGRPRAVRQRVQQGEVAGSRSRRHRTMAALNHQIDQFGLPVNPVEHSSRDVAAAILTPEERAHALARLRGMRQSWQDADPILQHFAEQARQALPEREDCRRPISMRTSSDGLRWALEQRQLGNVPVEDSAMAEESYDVDLLEGFEEPMGLGQQVGNQKTPKSPYSRSRRRSWQMGNLTRFQHPNTASTRIWEPCVSVASQGAVGTVVLGS
eukprot:TRINITY_DN3343_c0_g1_i2.p1 TRINITY_DN3343_c0_g1~~TRINITY_DN3343_c0_g1_i2.p1  ORF type:complete len:336 (-),score=40.03 TRINITY_DN3343_c0_g1_i2:234-1241(-)